eukprot:5645597-Amphidinium_carterae.1
MTTATALSEKLQANQVFLATKGAHKANYGWLRFGTNSWSEDNLIANTVGFRHSAAQRKPIPKTIGSPHTTTQPC